MKKNKYYEVDVACDVLRERRVKVYYRDLLDEIVSRLNLAPLNAKQLAEIYTQINLDSRLSYLGKGDWGLTEWMPQSGSRSQVYAPPEEDNEAVEEELHRRRTARLEIEEEFSDDSKTTEINPLG